MEKRVALPPLYPTAATDTAIGCQKSIREAVSTRTGLIPELVAIIVQYNTTIPLRVSTLTRKAKANELDRPHYAALWSPTQLLRSESGSGGSVSGVRLADDAVLLVTDYEHNLIQAINLVSGKITPFAGGEKSVVEGTKALEFRFSTPTGISVHPCAFECAPPHAPTTAS